MIGQSIDPSLYAAVGYEGGVTLQALAGCAWFLNQLWFISLQPGSNGPYWSLGYEAWYYLIFAVFFFTPGRTRWLAAGLAAVIAGPKILLLMPVWLTGVFVWRQISSRRPHKYPSRTIATLLAVTPFVLFLMAHKLMLHAQLAELTRTWLGLDGMAMIGFSDTFLWANILGILVAIHLFGMSLLLAGQTQSSLVTGKVEPAIRWLAGGSFALYLVHFPLMHFFAAVLPGTPDIVWRQALLLVIPIMLAYVFAELTERRRVSLQTRLRSLLGHRRSELLPQVGIVES